MSSASPPKPGFQLEEFAVPDARDEPDFDPAAYPAADGLALEDDGEPDLLTTRKRAFLSLYYRLNTLYAQLGAAREKDDEDTAQEILKAIGVQYDLRQNLERHYAPIGFTAEPELEGVTITKLAFSHSRLGDNAPAKPEPMSAFVRIDLPEEIQQEIFGSTTPRTD